MLRGSVSNGTFADAPVRFVRRRGALLFGVQRVRREEPFPVQRQLAAVYPRCRLQSRRVIVGQFLFYFFFLVENSFLLFKLQSFLIKS